MPIGPVRQIYKWIEAAGVFAFERDFSTARVDGLSQVVDGVAVMLINSTFPVDRKRLTIAHELGHIVLHSGRYIPEDPEDEANRFAAEFLMPETAIAPYLNKVDLASLQPLSLSGEFQCRRRSSGHTSWEKLEPSNVLRFTKQ